MHLPLTILLLTLLLLTTPSHTLTTPTLPTLTNQTTTTLSAPIIGVPTCRRLPGGFTLLLCARLLTGLKSLPDYRKQEIWSEYATGAYRLPVVFVQTDPVTAQTCHLTMDLYEPGVPVTASETFSLQGEQGDLNRIYFDCLKKYGTAGFARIGLNGYVAALLGPALEGVGGEEEEVGFGGLTNGSRSARVIDLSES